MAETILITGATSGIGRALALEFARRGHDLALTARRSELLEELRDEIATIDAQRKVAIRRLDVTNHEAIHPCFLEVAEELGGLDVIVANAGIARARKAGQDPTGEGDGFESDAAIIATNLIGGMATVDAAIRIFKAQGHGQVVGVSSVAAFRGMPGNSAYCASKAGFSTYLEAVRSEVSKRGIIVTTLSPGYIDTPLNNMLESRPFLVSVDVGAKAMADLIEQKVEQATVPVWPWNVVGFALRNTPDFLLRRAVG